MIKGFINLSLNDLEAKFSCTLRVVEYLDGDRKHGLELQLNDGRAFSIYGRYSSKDEAEKVLKQICISSF